MYDYLIVGAGLFGAVFAHEARKRGKEVVVIDKRDHIGGNIYTRRQKGIDVHVYGAHIFHTSDREVWEYIREFGEFNHYVNSPIARYHEELYNLPFNMNTFSKLWGVVTPAEAMAKIEEQRKEVRDRGIKEASNLEEQALLLAGRDIYEKLIREYTEKQWGRPCTDLPAFIIKRLPFRFTYDNNYFNDPYQGIPREGYTRLVERMLEGIEVFTSTDYKDIREDVEKGLGRFAAKKILYTGMIDEFFDFSLGHLSYRTVSFETEEVPVENYQGVAVVNYTSKEVPYTRVIEHKHFTFGKTLDGETTPTTFISREYSTEWKPGMEPYYPLNDEKNSRLYEDYAGLAANRQGRVPVLFGGRLGQYKYYDMDKVIRAALNMVSEEL